jgi:hypothetical protein
MNFSKAFLVVLILKIFKALNKINFKVQEWGVNRILRREKKTLIQQVF